MYLEQISSIVFGGENVAVKKINALAYDSSHHLPLSGGVKDRKVLYILSV